MNSFTAMTCREIAICSLQLGSAASFGTMHVVREAMNVFEVLCVAGGHLQHDAAAAVELTLE